ncbi:hypothetical protein NM208_g10247 [Fusarium decemcellulare]|uniref:Uncharacterized protein n=1 Tax=Fusarium decemcellulare TaxID=57161 RepID=A0ACC1RYN7_9HYPO|nr:hypothetical protein NM208_g10247 [Fusarium decemcellulare]
MPRWKSFVACSRSLSARSHISLRCFSVFRSRNDSKQQSDFLEEFIQRQRLPQKTIDHFSSLDWAQKILDDPAYEAVPFYSQYHDKDTDENRFFARMASTDTIIPHILPFRLKSFNTPEAGGETAISAANNRPELLCLMSLGHDLQAHPSIVHGGFQGVIFDEIMRTVVLLHYNNVRSPGPRDKHFTANMNMSYVAPLAAPSDVFVRGWLTGRQGRKWFPKAEIVSGDGNDYHRVTTLQLFQPSLFVSSSNIMRKPSSLLRADLFNAPAILTSEHLPDGSSGAVLVDTLFTIDQGVSLGDWLEDTLGGKRLATIYITHGHGDHWFNLRYLVKRFPGVEVVATQESIEHMSTQCTPEYRTFWQNLFPGQIDDGSFNIIAKPLKDNKFTLEGHALEAVPVGHSDCDNTSFLHVPSLRLAVAGDIVYNDVHMWMAEPPSKAHRDEWIRCLDRLETYSPSIVIGSHHRPGAVDGAFNIEASRQYIKTFSKLVEESKSAKELYDKVLAAYPNRIGKLVLWLGCKANFPSSGDN